MNNCHPKYFKSFYGVKCNSPQDFVKLFHDQGRRQYEVQEYTSKIISRIAFTQYWAWTVLVLLEYFHMTDYVLELLAWEPEHISSMDSRIKAVTLTPCFNQRLVIWNKEKSILNGLQKMLLARRSWKNE